MSRRRRVFVTTTLVLFMIAGCGPSTPPALADAVDVTGSVTLPDGKPLKTGTIVFETETTPARTDQAAVTDGKFKLKMFVGQYKVAFDTESRKTPVPAKYTKMATTDLHAEVKNGVAPLTYELK